MITESGWLTFYLCTAVAILYFFQQPVVSFQSGIFLDAKSYFDITNTLRQGGDLSGPAPFVYRIALPWFVSGFPSEYTVSVYQWTNFGFGIGTILVLIALCQIHIKRWWITLIISLLYVCNLNSPFRFSAFYPVMTDPPAVFVCGLFLLIDLCIKRYTILWTLGLTLLAILGVMIREMVLLAPLSTLISFFILGNPTTQRISQTLYRIMPLCGAIVSLYFVQHFIESTSAYTFSAAIRGMIKAHSDRPLSLFLVPLVSFGPVVLILFVCFSRDLIIRLKPISSLVLFFLGVLCLTSIGGYHGVRIVFWSCVALLPILGVVIETVVEKRLKLQWSVLVGGVIGLQAVSMNVFGLIPDIINLSSVDHPEFYFLFPFGENGHYNHTTPHSMSPSLRESAFYQYLIITLVLLAWRSLFRKSPDKDVGHNAS